MRPFLNILCFGIVLLVLFWGPYPLWSGLWNHQPEASFVLWELRLPRVLLALGVGMALSVAGLSLQTLFGNPLAEPYFLGISGGAALGTLMGLMMGFPPSHPLITLSGFFSGLIVASIIFRLSLHKKVLRIERMLLGGIMVNGFISSLLLVGLSHLKEDHLQGYLHWMMGYITPMGWLPLGLLFGVLFVGSFILWLWARPLEILWTGEEQAFSLGVSVPLMRKLLFGVSVLLTATTVSLVGIIGFVGLIVPNLARMTSGHSQRALLVTCMTLGGTFLVAAEGLTRFMPSLSLPVGAVTAFLGVPYFLYLLVKQP